MLDSEVIKMDNKICTKSGCLTMKEHLMPLSADSQQARCKLAQTIIKILIETADKEEYKDECFFVADSIKETADNILELMNCN